MLVRYAVRNKIGQYLSASMRNGVWTSDRSDYQIYWDAGTARACAEILDAEVVDL